MDIGGWLRSLGLGQYEAAFRANEIDAEVLTELTDGDLEKLGLPLGHRKRLLKAIAALGGTFSAIPLIPAANPLMPRGSAERRQLTVMFCDLVGSTALSARLDPEDMREIIGAYHRCCAEQINKAGGFVAKYMGDGVLAYFGYPQAHEDDAERAVRAALALTDAVSRLRTEHDAALQVRIGVATGLVVVGDLIGEGDAQERGVVGDTPNLAARLQALAEPGQMVISNNTRRLTGGMFNYRDLGKVPLKGLADPVQAWQVTGISAVQSRFEAHHGTSFSPLVGRDEELELLMRRWLRAKNGEGQVVLLSGEPGIGKSRLTVALQERLQGEPHTRLRYFCSPQHANSAFHPVIAQLERAAGFERDDTPDMKLDKLSSLIGVESADDSDLRLLAELLSIPGGASFAPLDLSPGRKKEKTFAALTSQLETLSRPRPVLTVFEDVHWIDPSSRELLDTTIDRVVRLPVLLVITFRPEFHPPWTGQAHVTTLTLGRLGRREGTALAGSVAGNNVLPEEVVREIIERTDGIPLFVEELTKAVLEARVGQGDAASTMKNVPPSALGIPATLHASLMARLDRLGSVAREVAQIGAAIGREFSYEVLASITQKTEVEMQAALSRLTDAELVFCRGTPPLATFLFKHALVRDVAYGSLLRGERQQVHGRIAAVLAEYSPTTVEVEPEVLGHHYREAGLADLASTYFEHAGDRAAGRSAYIEATAHFRAAIDEADRLPDKDERARRALTLLLKLGPATIIRAGEWHPEVEAVYRRAHDLGREVGDGPKLFRATWGLWLYANRTRGRRARKWTEELISLAQRLGDESLLLEAQHCRWGDEFSAGNATLLLEASEEGIRRYDAKRHAHLANAFGGHDPGVCALGVHAIGLWLRGFADQARGAAERALALAERLSHPATMGHAHRTGAQVFMIGRDRSRCLQMGQRMVALAENFDLPIVHWCGRYIMGWANAIPPTLLEGLALMEEALPSVAGEHAYKLYAAPVAEARFDAGRVRDALALVDHALDTGEGPASGLFVSEIHRLRGVFLSRLGSAEEVERTLRTAIEIAEEQGALLLKLRASTSLARLWRDQGKRTEARDLLAPVYGWFTEGFDTPDLKEAKALLEELA
jgi:class 3 adenylate cyclase/tetratricopeptide (TPR) repeat protein